MLPEKLASGLVNQMSSSYYSILDAYTRNSDFESAQAWWKMADEIKLVKNEQMFDSYLTCNDILFL